MDNGLEDLGDLTISSGLTALTCINPDNLMRSKFSVFQDTITYYFFHQRHLLRLQRELCLCNLIILFYFNAGGKEVEKKKKKKKLNSKGERSQKLGNRLQ